ncbi:spore germination protein [Marinicrinis lubricantis]|uniref:Spore germination protein n=1 Tax=Marinicrinis lubricantis TaxID=2086470 RepID=A0ABW1ILG7_9BACL
MPHVINIYNLKINSISNNGSVNIGEAVHTSHTSNTKAQGSNSSYGDSSPPRSLMNNTFVDPDFNDMGEIANPAPVNAKQS